MPLVVCPTPIGNLEDVTLRALRELGEADARPLRGHAADARPPRPPRRSGAAAVVPPPQRGPADGGDAARGSRRGERIALASDAGLPGVNDPGARLVARRARARRGGDRAPGPLRGRDGARRQRARRRALHVPRLPPAHRAGREGLWEESGPGPGRRSPSSRRGGCRQRSPAWQRRPRPAGRCLPRADEAVRGGRARRAREVAERFGAAPKGEVTLVVGAARRRGAAPKRRGARGRRGAVAAGAPRRAAADVVARLTGVPRNRLYRGSL